MQAGSILYSNRRRLWCIVYASAVVVISKTSEMNAGEAVGLLCGTTYRIVLGHR